MDYRGSTFEDIDRLIRSEVAKACRAYNIDIRQHGEDLRQEGWVICVRKLPEYKEMGYKVTTYLFNYIRRDVRGAAQKIIKRHTHTIPVEDEFLGSFADDPGPESSRDVDWEHVDDFVLLHASGYSDKEIAEMTGESNVSRRRQRAHKDLLDQSG